jgi:hypothetical protein
MEELLYLREVACVTLPNMFSNVKNSKLEQDLFGRRLAMLYIDAIFPAKESKLQ